MHATNADAKARNHDLWFDDNGEIGEATMQRIYSEDSSSGDWETEEKFRASRLFSPSETGCVTSTKDVHGCDRMSLEDTLERKLKAAIKMRQDGDSYDTICKTLHVSKTFISQALKGAEPPVEKETLVTKAFENAVSDGKPRREFAVWLTAEQLLKLGRYKLPKWFKSALG